MTAPTLNKASEKIASRETLRLCTAGSVDDGKSTFVGRLLHDTKSVLADQLASVERTSADRGFEGLDLSLLVDGLRAEREQGITIDVAYRYFATDKRTFILADTPGHVQYTRNTVTGVSTSQVVVLLVDARHGVVEQTRRHLSVSALLGVRTVILAVNKIDLVDYSEEVFRNIEKEFVGLASALDVTDTHVVPISALKGDNVAEPSTHMDWYTGPTVLEILENVEVSHGRAHDLGFRFPIQYVIREHATDYRGYAGTINAGSVSVGDTVYLPEGRTTQVTHIDSADGSLQTASVGEAVVLRLAQEIDLIRGELIAGEDRPESVRSFNATVVGLADRTIKPGAAVKVRYGTELVRGRVAAIERVLDIDGVNDNEAPETYGLNDIAHVRIDVAGELEVEDYAARGAIGSFLLIDQSSGDTLAAGLVGHRLRNNWSI
ncbi:sulfate adenylyltransferase subunit 1 [Corynebacterium glutamicum MB001]|uniref:sulfate adenylyltransferase n=3 Tax=Corynebacterium TaxID=1716 RepID=Q8NLX2_CORGL|nr:MULTISPECIES: GTP-binding protein [Corynebacterium]AGT06523.1 sulfate adenylyltransferase subunit 1 [Corynebacterium glutamicum MB001]AKF28570.1 sulfate adenylyltransferase [[Brevibacterium] flavum]ANE09407.1 sulfate adenylyltransferase [Corynebacterium glutamicum]ARV65995.1 sulfate adenylyltransferase [Corynebacterium glutamicum]AST21817.1 sulfate adenylyltransferase [Corynebacterium glutamicum ATCC 14067]